MCTVVSARGKHRYTGRTLDLEYSYNECVTVTPRQYPFVFTNGDASRSHTALVGMAAVSEGVPLYFDAMNEQGLCMAGLHFPTHCYFPPPQGTGDEVAPFELIPRVLTACQTVAQVREWLSHIRLVDRPFSDTMLGTPLHWMVSDGTECVVIEPTKEGLLISDNTVGVMTNSPPFAMQMANLCQYRHLSATGSKGNLANLPPYSKGQGAFGLPGDLTSMSRFVRAVFTRENARFSARVSENIEQMFHLMDTVLQVRGCNRTADGEEITRYTAVMDADTGVYYYTTYHNRRITAVDLHRAPIDRDRLVVYPLMNESSVYWQNR
ncbi:MAG: choloylglycine hydrolase [Clostridia bacterium]|nr:choloylglycine hydrolase [Clostridia bacterium]